MDIQTPNSAPAAPRKPSVVIWAVVGIIVVVAGIIVWANMNRSDEEPISPQPPVTVTVPQTAEEIAVRDVAVLDTSREAIGSGNEDKCAQLLTKDEQDTCRAYVVTSEAQQQLDASLCNSIAAEYWQTNCKDQVTTYKAISARNPALCSGMIDKDRVATCLGALGL